MQRRMFTAAGVALALTGAAPAVAGARPSDCARRVCSTATVVVPKGDASGKVKLVGTSTITVAPGVPAASLPAHLKAADGSAQSYVVIDGSGRMKRSGRVQDGDRVVVTAQDGAHTVAYRVK